MKAYLEPEEIEKLENAALFLRDKLLIMMLFHLGCRISEALGISVEDIDLGNGTVTIQHLKTRLQLSCPNCRARLSRRHSFCPGCGAKVAEAVAEEKEHRRQRVLPVDSELLTTLKDYIKRGGSVNRDGKKLLFGINRHRAWQIVRECAERAGLPALINPETGKRHGVSPHKLRDAFAVFAMKTDDSGDGLRMLQEHLGHASFNTTAKYRKISGEELKTWHNKLWEKKNDNRTSKT
jgi:integrase/recombinase XerD